jgi:hypothetical protein
LRQPEQLRHQPGAYWGGLCVFSYHSAKIHDETLHDEILDFALDTKFPESDHAPFVAEFEVPDV